MLIFEAIQIVLSQIPDLHQTWLLSTISAIASVGYACICVGLSIGKTSGQCQLDTLQQIAKCDKKLSCTVYT